MVMELPVKEVFDAVGHDGSTVVRDEPEPLNRLGHHPQELIQKVANPRGWYVQMNEARPRHGDGILVKVPFLIDGTGILLTARHAVVYHEGKIYDPSKFNSHCRSYQVYMKFISVSGNN